MHPLLDTIVHFVQTTFINKTRFPIISITLFIIVITLNIIQYIKKDKNFLQNTIKKTLTNTSNETTLQNSALYVFDLIGINGLLNNGLFHILFFGLTYSCMALIEMNIGYIPLMFLLLSDLMFNFSVSGFRSSICENNLNDGKTIQYSPYCCGSFVLFMSLGVILYLIYKHTKTGFNSNIMVLLIFCVWIGCILYDKYISLSDIKEGTPKTCKSFTWHALNFIFGVFAGVALGN